MKYFREPVVEISSGDEESKENMLSSKLENLDVSIHESGFCEYYQASSSSLSPSPINYEKSSAQNKSSIQTSRDSDQEIRKNLFGQNRKLSEDNQKTMKEPHQRRKSSNHFVCCKCSRIMESSEIPQNQTVPKSELHPTDNSEETYKELFIRLLECHEALVKKFPVQPSSGGCKASHSELVEKDSHETYESCERTEKSFNNSDNQNNKSSNLFHSNNQQLKSNEQHRHLRSPPVRCQSLVDIEFGTPKKYSNCGTSDDSTPCCDDIYIVEKLRNQIANKVASFSDEQLKILYSCLKAL